MQTQNRISGNAFLQWRKVLRLFRQERALRLVLISGDYAKQKLFFSSLSGRFMPKLLKIVFTFKFHPFHAKISTPTGTPIPDEKVKELSSFAPPYPLTVWVISEPKHERQGAFYMLLHFQPDGSFIWEAS